MRVNPIYTYNRFISAPKNKQVSFGLIENEENTKRVLPKNSDYRIPFDKQWQCLKDHDAVTVTSEGDKAWAKINPGFEDRYGRLDGSNFMKFNYLKGLEDQDQFDSFYDALGYLDQPPSTKSYSIGPPEDQRSAFEIATEGGFGYKVD